MTDALPPLTSAEIADLRAKAKAATRGPFATLAEMAANPETILRLIDMIERRDGVLKKLEEALIAGGSELMSNRQRLIDLVREVLAATEPHDE